MKRYSVSEVRYWSNCQAATSRFIRLPRLRTSCVLNGPICSVLDTVPAIFTSLNPQKAAMNWFTRRPIHGSPACPIQTRQGLFKNGLLTRRYLLLTQRHWYGLKIISPPSARMASPDKRSIHASPPIRLIESTGTRTSFFVTLCMAKMDWSRSID